MSDNDNTPPTNVVGFEQAKSKLNEAKAGDQPPPVRNLEIVTEKGEVLAFRGYLLVTGGFVGATDVEGIIQLVVPLHNLGYARIVPDAPAPAAA